LTGFIGLICFDRWEFYALFVVLHFSEAVVHQSVEQEGTINQSNQFNQLSNLQG
jgi:hypothetical protein